MAFLLIQFVGHVHVIVHVNPLSESQSVLKPSGSTEQPVKDIKHFYHQRVSKRAKERALIVISEINLGYEFLRLYEWQMPYTAL